MQDDRPLTVERLLNRISRSINEEQYMLMEYLGPIVDGCRTALSVSVEEARTLHKLSESEFEKYMENTGSAFSDLAICFDLVDVDESYSLVFEKGRVVVYDDCLEPNVVVKSDRETILALLDSDPSFSLENGLGKAIQIIGEDSMEVVEALGFLCYPSLLRVAQSGVDPSSLLSEDADAIILAAASDAVTNVVRKWIDLQLTKSHSTSL
ncbi:MAG: hypothetical protein ACFFAY_05135 [Promethearchaeota archaeon]